MSENWREFEEFCNFIIKENIFELSDFISAMAKRIQEKKGKYGDSWKTCVIGVLRDKLGEEYDEWQAMYHDEVHSSSERELIEIVDIANVCFFLFTRLKKWIEEEVR